MRSKRLALLVILILALLLAGSGCARPVTTQEPEPPELPDATDTEPTPEPPPETVPAVKIPDSTTLGGVRLGDKGDRVALMLGSNYGETFGEELGYYGEKQKIWSYPRGITVTIGQKTGNVLRLEVNTAEYATNLGVRVGDPAAAVLEQHRALYSEYQGVHSDGPLIGWFAVEKGGLLILDLDESDGTLLNEAVGEASRVELIVLAYAKHFD